MLKKCLIWTLLFMSVCALAHGQRYVNLSEYDSVAELKEVIESGTTVDLDMFVTDPHKKIDNKYFYRGYIGFREHGFIWVDVLIEGKAE